MDRKKILFATLTVSAVCGAEAQQKSEHPNILFILTDDLGARDLGCFGSTFYETPNLDALARDGMCFTNGYASCNVSSPTRASLMTGKYPARLKITDWIPGRQAKPGANDPYSLIPPEFTLSLPLEEETLGEAFRENGYQTMFVGKWHLGEDVSHYPQNQGFDINIAGCNHGQPPQGYFTPYGLYNLPDGPEGEYLTDRLGNECVKLIENRDKHKPFLLYYAMYQVHTPLQAKPEKIAYFQEKAARMGLTEENSTTQDREWIREIPIRGRLRERIRQGHPVYAAMVSHMDDNIGKIIRKLKEDGLYDNTIIVFTADNGGLSTAEGSPTCNAPYRTGKGWGYEGGVREPLIVHWSGHVKSGTHNESIVTSCDFYPTLLDLAGLPLKPEQHLDGESFAHSLLTGETKDRGPIYWHYPHYSNQGGRPHGAVRSGRYKLIEFYEDMHVELFDLEKDPSETTDISALHEAETQRLTRLLHEWRQEVGAAMPLPKNNAVE